MTHRSSIAVAGICCVFIAINSTGCASLGPDPAAVERVKECEANVRAGWSEQNRQQNLAFGVKVFDKDFDEVFTAIVTAVSDIGLSVKNMERASGYILAEGYDPRPGSDKKATSQGVVDELNSCDPEGLTGKWSAAVGNYKISYTFNLLRMKGAKRTKVKVRVGTVDIKGGLIAHTETFPPSLEGQYKTAWRAIDRQVFLDANLDK